MAGHFTLVFRSFILAFKLFLTYTYADIAPDQLLKIVFDPSPNEIFLDEPLTVKCERAAGAVTHDGASIFLHCPIAPWDSFCFQNCISACAGEEPGRCPYEEQLNHITCRTVVTQDGHVTNEYSVDKVTREWLGLRPDGKPSQNGFYCKTAGLQTPEVWLTPALKPVHSPVEDDTAPTPLPTPYPPKGNSIELPTTPKSISKSASKIEAATQTDEFGLQSSAILRECLIILAIAIIFLSLTVNVFCCIRCALIRQYSKNKEKARMQNLFCMAEEIRNARSGFRSVDGPWNGNCLRSQTGLSLLNRDANCFTNDLGPICSLSGQPAYYVPANFMHNTASHPVAFSGSRSNTASRSEFYDTNAAESVTALPLMTGSIHSGTTNPSLHYDVRRRVSKRSSVHVSTESEDPQHIPSQIHLAAAVAAYCAQQQHNLNELQQQLQMDDFSLQSPHTGSGGLCSYPGSVGNPDSSLLEPQPHNSLCINSLCRNQSSKEPLFGICQEASHKLTNPKSVKSGEDSEVEHAPSGTANLIGLYPLSTGQRLQTNGKPLFSVPEKRSEAMAESTNSLSHRLGQFTLKNSKTNLSVTSATSISPSDSGTGTANGEQITSTTNDQQVPTALNNAIVAEVTKVLLDRTKSMEAKF